MHFQGILYPLKHLEPCTSSCFRDTVTEWSLIFRNNWSCGPPVVSKDIDVLILETTGAVHFQLFQGILLLSASIFRNNWSCTSPVVSSDTVTECLIFRNNWSCTPSVVSRDTTGQYFPGILQSQLCVWSSVHY